MRAASRQSETNHCAIKTASRRFQIRIDLKKYPDYISKQNQTMFSDSIAYGGMLPRVIGRPIRYRILHR